MTANKILKKIINLNSIFNNETIRNNINHFFKRTNFKSNFISILIKIRCNNGFVWYTLNERIVLDVNNSNDIKEFRNLLYSNNNKLDESYKITLPDQMIIEYFYVKNIDYQRDIRNRNIMKTLDKQINNIEITTYKNLPLNNAYTSWGKLENLTNNNVVVSSPYFDQNIKNIISQNVDRYTNNVTVEYNNGEHFYFTDFQTHKDGIRRDFNNGKILYFMDRKPLFEINNSINLKNISVKERSESYINNIITLDIETYFDENKNMYPLSASFYDGRESKSIYITDYSNVTQFYNSLFDNLFIPKYDGKIVYIHNGSKFDLVFLLKELSQYKEIYAFEILKKDSEFLNINCTWFSKVEVGKKQVKYSLDIRDSLLMLKSSLNSLGKSFNVEVQKDIFPYMFPNKNNLNYIGLVPEYKYFENTKVSLEEYDVYKSSFYSNNQMWNLKTEIIKYCENDCISLYQIISKFSKLIFDRFSINLNRTPTLSSLALRIYSTDYIPYDTKIVKSITPWGKEVEKEVKVSKIDSINSNNLFETFKQAFYGGHTESYIPTNIDIQDLENIFNVIESKGGELGFRKFIKDNSLNLEEYIVSLLKHTKPVFHYDVNSLYPSVMKGNIYPVKLIKEFIGDIRLMKDLISYYFNNKILGIYLVDIEVDENILHPLLPKFIHNKSVYAAGKFRGWYTSVDLRMAEKVGYKFTILKGYLFEGDYIFDEYISDMYNIKCNTPKSDPMYLISKLLMNSLFGRFGLNPKQANTRIIHKNDFKKVFIDNNIKIEDIIEFNNDKMLVSSYSTNDICFGNSNVAISAFVTSYAREAMSIFKNLIDLSIYYTDTDSLVTDKPLPNDAVDSKQIGKYTLENEYIIFISLGKKTYFTLTKDFKTNSKIKGYTKPVDLLSFLLLLKKDSVKILNHNKWVRNFEIGNIQINDTPYKLGSTINTRTPIYKNNFLIDTSNIILK